MKALDFFYDVFIVNTSTGKEVRAQIIYGKAAAITTASEFNKVAEGCPLKAVVKSRQ